MSPLSAALFRKESYHGIMGNHFQVVCLIDENSIHFTSGMWNFLTPYWTYGFSVVNLCFIVIIGEPNITFHLAVFYCYVDLQYSLAGQVMY